MTSFPLSAFRFPGKDFPTITRIHPMTKSITISLAVLTLGSLCSVAIGDPATKADTQSDKADKATTPTSDWRPLYRGSLDDFRIYFRGQGYIDDVHKQDVFVAEPGQIHVRKGTNGLIATKAPYSHYHVKVDYRWGAKGGSMNAGLMSHVDLNSKRIKDNRPRSVEINMKADAPGSIWLASKLGPFASSFVDKKITGRRGTKTYLPKDQGGVAHDASPFSNRTVLANYPGKKPNSNPNSNAHGEWNTLEAIVRGADSVEIIHNGHTVNLITNLRDLKKGSKEPGEPLVEGGIGLQSEGQEIFYRNFVIKELKPPSGE
ncbi:MAG: DUF1080 domain-containing protein [Akkermansiaceae bacterium]|nr:DUF1080 domain-containing protein [Akkermansiaceae bacterium]